MTPAARSRTRHRRVRRRDGATLLQAATAVCIVGILLAAFVPAFVREVRLSKVSEAAEMLASMHRGAAAYFATEFDAHRHCLPEAAGPTPAEPTPEPQQVDWADPELEGGATWRSLAFSPPRPTRFAYTFEPVTVGCDLRTAPNTYLVTFGARGDLDADGERSIFERRAHVGQDGSLEPIGILYVRDRVE